MSHTSSFLKIKKWFLKHRIINTKKDLFLCLSVLILQLLAIVFGVFFRGFGTPIDLERRAQIYSSYNKKAQTYSLVRHPSNNPLSNLDYHIRMVEENKDMINARCKIFFTNSIDEKSNRAPFSVELSEKSFDSPIAFLSNTSKSIVDYFEIKVVAGNCEASDYEVAIDLNYADSIQSHFGVSNYDGLIGKTLLNQTDKKEYSIVGIFDKSDSYLEKYYSGSLIIGNFESFSRIAVNPCFGFITGKLYLENLFFLYRITVYIDPPSYNRSTIVSTKGNDFGDGGDDSLTNLLYYTEVREAHFIVQFLSWFLAFVSIGCTLYFYLFKFDNKKCIRVLAIMTLLMAFTVSVIALIINQSIIGVFSPYLGMLNGLLTSTYFIAFIIVCAVLDSGFVNKRIKNVELDDDYYIINI